MRRGSAYDPHWQLAIKSSLIRLEFMLSFPAMFAMLRLANRGLKVRGRVRARAKIIAENYIPVRDA